MPSAGRKPGALLLSSSVVVGVVVAPLVTWWGWTYISNRRSKRLAARIKATVRRVEDLVQHDESKRGIEGLGIPHELYNATLHLYKAKTLAVITGFPCLVDYQPPTETDGPSGALAIARACVQLGQTVHLLTDECNYKVLLAAVAEAGLPRNLLQVASFPSKDKWGAADEARLMEVAQAVDVVVAIERAGPSISDGSYYTMRAVSMDKLVAPLDRLFHKPCRAWTIGIGDGGNEVGMGKIKDRILQSSILNASKICCSVSADCLIVASVSNWGGYALAAALALVAFQEGHFWTRVGAVRRCVVTVRQEKGLVQSVVSAGARDGITAELKLSVDGMPLETSLEVLQRIRDVAMDQWYLW